MELLQDDFSSLLDGVIKQINGLKSEGSDIQTLQKRIDLLSLGMGIISSRYNSFFSFKESHKVIDSANAINIDYKLSTYAGRFYTQANFIINLLNKYNNEPFVKRIPRTAVEAEMMAKNGYKPVSRADFIMLQDEMLRMAARWDIDKMMTTYELELEPKKRALPKRRPLLEECIFFANRMNAKKMGVKFDDGIMPTTIIFAVQPNAGKSYVVNVYSLMALCLHKIYFGDSGILRMSNNASNALGFSTQIKAMLENKIISTIYPEFKKYFKVEGKPTILDKTTAEEWKMADLDPRIRASFFARGREAAINSIRIFVALTIDDLSDGFEQMNNDEAHQEMTTKFEVDMDSRKEGEDIPTFIAGTMFNEFDVPNTIIRKLEDAGLLIKNNKYKNVRNTPDYSTVVIAVDCFDDKGNSAAPDLISTEKLKQKQDSLKPYEFDLVYRQVRASREPRVFDYGNLKLYDKLPKTLKQEKVAVLDPNRRNGADFFALPIFAFDTESTDAYFIDAIYEQKSLGKTADPQNKFLDKIVKFLVTNNVREFYIENNTSNTLGTVFEEKFKALKYNCKITEIYTAKVGYKGSTKTSRILDEESTITANIWFPKPNLYPPLHRISQFMTDFTRWDDKNNNTKQHDDAPDSVRIFSKNCLFNRNNRYSAVKGIDKSKLWCIR